MMTTTVRAKQAKKFEARAGQVCARRACAPSSSLLSTFLIEINRIFDR